MRDCFGDGLVVQAADGNGFGIEALGLHKPLTLLPSASGATVDLAPFTGKILSFSGALELIDGNLEELRIQLAELHQPAADTPMSPVWAVVWGNLGKPPEVNPKGDRVGASLAYASGSWLRLAAYPYYACADRLKEMETGSSITVYGAMETYAYKEKDRLQLAVRGFTPNHLGGGAKKPTTIFSEASASHGAQMPTDAFTLAA
jgi:hypothetical protein